MIEELEDWCVQNNILIQEEDERVFTIDGVGKFYLVVPNKGVVLANEFSKKTEDYYLNLTDDEKDFVLENDFDYFVFKFGNRFYYSKLKQQKDQLNDISFIPELTPFLNVGEYTSQIEIPFINLGVHTGYELLNGSAEPKNWVKKAKFYNHNALGICDKNTLAGTLAHQIECDENGVKPILGATYSVAYDYDEKKSIQDTFDIVLYVRDYVGWGNILRVNKAVNVDFDGFVPEEVLLSYTEGLICVIPKDSYFNRLLDNPKEFKSRVELYGELFDDIFYQIDLNEYEDDGVDIDNLKNVKKYLKTYTNTIKPIYIPDTYYCEQIDFGVKSMLNNVDRVSHPSSKEQYYKDVDKIFEQNIGFFQNEEKMGVFIEALGNTVDVVGECDFKISTGEHKLPKFPHKDPIAFYHELLEKGFEKKIIAKYGDDEEKLVEYMERLEEENGVIVGAGFVDYFLILWDIIEWCKTKNILVGPGRGSAGGSLVAYLLGVIEVDPIQYDLLFERFLNKTRVSGERAKSADAMPDIDLDFEGLRRNEVKKYMEQKYGLDNVCSVGTYTRMKVKSAIKDFGRVKKLPFKDVNVATTMIPDAIKSYWKDIIDTSFVEKRFKKFVQENAELCEDIIGVMGQPRSSSIHASAMLVVPKEDKDGVPMTIFDWMPVRNEGGDLISEWEGKYVERAGFLKEDILGLLQLDKFGMMLDLIEKNRGFRLDLNKIPTSNKKVFQYFQKGWNEDVFQFGTQGLKSFSKKVLPDNVEDLISMNALFRPGPMDSGAHEDFAKIKHKKKKAKFDPYMEVVTAKTYGLYVFQEQVMQAMVVGGLTLSEADVVRTQMKKFDNEGLAKFKKKFVKGYSKLFKKGDGEKTAQEVWDKLYAFSSYGFNRSHAAAYSLMGYWCQYLKVKYPLEFWATSLNMAKETEIPNRLSEINVINLNSKKQIKILPPDINKAEERFACDPEENAVFWSITKIKNVGPVAVKKILEVRNEGGEFFSFEEFLDRVPKNKVNKRVVTCLIVAGAFDSVEFGGEATTEGFIIGKQPRNRFEFLKMYYQHLGEELPEDIKNARNKNWFWTIKQKELTGFGNIDYKSLLVKKTKNKKFLDMYWDADRFISWIDPKGKRDFFDNGEPCVLTGKMFHLIKKKDKNGSDFYKISIENNNKIIYLVAFKDAADKLGKTLEMLDENKGMFAISGGAMWDSWKEFNVLKLNKNSKIVEL